MSPRIPSPDWFGFWWERATGDFFLAWDLEGRSEAVIFFMFRIPERALLELMHNTTYLLAHFVGVETAVQPVITLTSFESYFSFSDSLAVGTSISYRTPTSSRLEE